MRIKLEVYAGHEKIKSIREELVSIYVFVRNNAINHVDVLGVGGAGIGVDCENIPENLTMPMSNPGFCGCKSRVTTTVTFHNADFRIDCSIAECTTGCDIAAAAATALGRLGALAIEAAKVICYETCHFICRNP